MVCFFQIAISVLAYLATFSEQLYFGKSYFFTLFQSNYSDTTVTFSEQLFLQNSCFFVLFQNSHSFARVFFFRKNFLFGGKLLPSYNAILRIIVPCHNSWKNINKKGRNFFVPSLKYCRFGQDGEESRTFFMKIS